MDNVRWTLLSNSTKTFRIMRRQCRVFRWGDQLLIGPRRALWRLSDHTGEFGEQPHTDYTGRWATTKITSTQRYTDRRMHAHTDTYTHTQITETFTNTKTNTRTETQIFTQTQTMTHSHTDLIHRHKHTHRHTHAHTHLLQTKMGNHKDYNWIGADRGGH